MSIRRQRGFLKRQADAQRSLLDGSQQGTLRIATPYKVTAGRRGVLAAGGNADAGAHLHLTSEPAAAVAAGGSYSVSWTAQDPAHPAAGYAETVLTFPMTAVPVVVAGYYDLQVLARWATSLAWSVEIVRTRGGTGTVVWPPAVIPQAARFTDAVGAVHVLAVELLAGDTITATVKNNSAGAGTLQAAHLSLSLVDRSRGVVTDPIVPKKFVAVGYDVVLTSPDGTNWTAATNPVPATTLWDVYRDHTGRVAVGAQTGAVATSDDDAATWTVRDAQFGTAPVRALMHDKAGRWVAAGANEGSGLQVKVSTSTDGAAWTALSPPLTPIYRTILAVGYHAGTWVLVQENGVGTGGDPNQPPSVYVSTDGLNYTEYETAFPISSGFAMDIAYGAGLWVIVGSGDRLQTSPDAKVWTLRTSSFTGGETIYAVAYGDGRFTAVGSGGKIATSTDGISWSQVTNPWSGTFTDIRDVTYDGLWVAVASDGRIATSPDGLSWSLVTSPTTNALYAITR